MILLRKDVNCDLFSSVFLCFRNILLRIEVICVSLSPDLSVSLFSFKLQSRGSYKLVEIGDQASLSCINILFLKKYFTAQKLFLKIKQNLLI